jgi:predicted nucleotidyltransferase
VTPDLEHENRTIIDLLRDAIDHLIAVYRFGSTVDGRAHQASDTDVAVLARRPIFPSCASTSAAMHLVRVQLELRRGRRRPD